MSYFSTDNVLQEKKQRAEHAFRLIEKYSKDKRFDGLQERIRDLSRSNPLKARLIAEKLENQEKYIQKLIESGRLTEATFSTSFGVTPERVLKTTLLGTAMSNRPNWMMEQTLQTMNDVFWYIKKTRDTSVRGATAGEMMLEVENYNHANELMPLEAVGTGNGSTTVFTATLTRSAVPFTTRILTNASGNGYAYVATEGVSGVIAGTGITGTISGTALSVTFGTAPATGVLIKVEYHYNSEDPSLYAANASKVSLVASSAKFRPRPKTIGVKYSDLARLTYDTVFPGQSLQDDLVVAMAEEMAASRDYEGIDTYVRMANSNALVTFDAQFASFSEVSDELHARKVWDIIRRAESTVNNDQKRGGNFTRLIAGSDAAIYLGKDKGFDRTGEQNKTAGSWYIGKNGKMEVFETIPSSTRLATDEVLLINYTPDENTEPAAVAGVLTELEASLRTPDFMTDAQMARVEDIIQINPKFVRKLKISNISFSLAVG